MNIAAVAAEKRKRGESAERATTGRESDHRGSGLNSATLRHNTVIVSTRKGAKPSSGYTVLR